MPVLNSIGRVAVQRTHDEHASKVSPEGWISLFLGFAILGGYVLEIRIRSYPFCMPCNGNIVLSYSLFYFIIWFRSSAAATPNC